MSDPIAYFLTWHTYGSWLHGNERGSVDQRNDVFGEPFASPEPAREQWERASLSSPPVRLDEHARAVVQRTVVEVCEHRGWRLYASHVRTTHVHAVVAAGAAAEKAMNDFKVYATRRLREANLVLPDAATWSRHGSTRYVWSEDRLRSVVKYVVDEQGVSLTPLPFLASSLRG